MHRVRVGIVSYLNAWPLSWGLLRGDHADFLDAAAYPPAQVADRLRDGAIDVGLVPSIEVQRIPGLAVVPGLCVAAVHEVRSVLLVLRRPLHEVRRVALDLNSRTSATLVQVLCADRWNIAPEFVQAPPEPERMLAEADAALVIGDPALRIDRRRWTILDLAAEWRDLTGHPFVFAVWAVREGVRRDRLERALHDSLRRGLTELEALVERAARELGLPAREIREYLTRYLSYDLGTAELAGLREFYRRAAVHGLIATDRPVAPSAA